MSFMDFLMWTPKGYDANRQYEQYTPPVGQFTGIGDFVIGKQTNQSIQMVALAALAIGAVYLLKK